MQPWRKHFFSAREAAAAGQWAACLDHARRVVELKPEAAGRVNLLVARANTALGRADEARLAWSAVLISNPSSAPLFAQAVRSAQKLRSYRLALVWAQMLFEMEASPEAALVAARCALALGDADLALDYLRVYVRPDRAAAAALLTAPARRSPPQLVTLVSRAVVLEHGPDAALASREP